MSEQTGGTEELLVGITFDEDNVELVVISNGCTSEDDFEIEVNKGFTGQPPYRLTVRRIRPDNCKMTPHPVTLKFSRSDLGLEEPFELHVTNMFRSPVGRA